MGCPRLSAALVSSIDLPYLVSSRASLGCRSWRFDRNKLQGHMTPHATTHQFSTVTNSLSKTRSPIDFGLKIHPTLPNLSRASEPGPYSASMSTPAKESRLIVISGPSGVGKGTLIQKLFDAHPDTFAFTVSHTTRAPRVGEVEGKNYFFVTPATFNDLISQGAFVEHAKFGGNQYGTSKKTISDQTSKGLIVILDIEMAGVQQIKANPSIDARYIFIKPPSFEALETRLRGRGTEKDEDIHKRLQQAKAELDYADTGVHDKIIVNDDLQAAYQELEEFIFSRN